MLFAGLAAGLGADDEEEKVEEPVADEDINQAILCDQPDDVEEEKE